MSTNHPKPRTREIPEWQELAEKMLGSQPGTLDREYPALFARLDAMNNLVKRAKPWGGLRSSQVVALVVQDHLKL